MEFFHFNKLQKISISHNFGIIFEHRNKQCRPIKKIKVCRNCWGHSHIPEKMRTELSSITNHERTTISTPVVSTSSRSTSVAPHILTPVVLMSSVATSSSSATSTSSSTSTITFALSHLDLTLNNNQDAFLNFEENFQNYEFVQDSLTLPSSESSSDDLDIPIDTLPARLKFMLL